LGRVRSRSPYEGNARDRPHILDKERVDPERGKHHPGTSKNQAERTKVKNPADTYFPIDAVDEEHRKGYSEKAHVRETADGEHLGAKNGVAGIAAEKFNPTAAHSEALLHHIQRNKRVILYF